jgi:microcystin-dependent protein
MSDPFLAEVRIFPFNFPPTGWAFCDGQLLPISQSTALFSLLGTVYGGDGKSTFALPNVQGSVVMQPGQGQGLSLRDLGETSGVETITLLVSEIPLHTHTMRASQDYGEENDPENLALGYSTGNTMYNNGSVPTTLAALQALPPGGGGLPHSNMQPYLTLNFCIAMQGIFPQRP